MPEVVGDAGILVNPNNEEEIANAINQVLTDTEYRNRLRNAGLEQAKRFSWENTAGETLKVFESLR